MANIVRQHASGNDPIRLPAAFNATGNWSDPVTSGHNGSILACNSCNTRRILLATRHSSVLVLGSAGFVGARLCQQLAADSCKVHALGRSETHGLRNGINHVRGSIEDRQLLRAVLAECEKVVYCAAMTTPGTSATDPALEVVGNLLPLARLLELAPEFDKRHIVYLSSGGAIYGDGSECASESDALRPRSYYGAGKAAAEAMLSACVASSSWSATILRPSNLYGPGQPASKGFAIVPTLFERASDGQPFQIWGDGSIIRDYLYLDDLVDAITRSMGSAQTSRLTVYNVASRQTASILELISACEHASGRTIQREYKPARSVDVARIAPEPGLVESELGWTARTDLAAVLRNTWAWFTQTHESCHSSLDP